MLGCPVEATCSPAVERKVVAAATEGRSYDAASILLEELADVQVTSKRCARITQRVGRERLAQRDARLEAYETLSIPQQQQAPADAPANSWGQRVAAVLVDGGRAQLRDERWGQPHPPAERVSWWKEPKVACLATFSGSAQESDPLPEVPQCLLDPLWMIPRVKEIKGAAGGDQPPAAHEPTTAPGRDDKPPRWSPEPLVRSVVATFEPYEQLGRLAKVEAHHRGFAAAERKVFLGDGHLSNWGIHQRHFSHYTAVTDLMHALAYVYQAALESTPDMEACWNRCRQWITWVWQGDVQRVVDQLQQLVDQAGQPVPEKLSESLTYLTNNTPRMKYDQYRQAGLPITTTLIESTIKQINRRIKGTEKFWDEGAEPQLQLVVDRLSDTNPLAEYWRQKQLQQTGFRKSRTTT
jgi:hypothetical protein